MEVESLHLQTFSDKNKPINKPVPCAAAPGARSEREKGEFSFAKRGKKASPGASLPLPEPCPGPAGAEAGPFPPPAVIYRSLHAPAASAAPSRRLSPPGRPQAAPPGAARAPPRVLGRGAAPRGRVATCRARGSHPPSAPAAPARSPPPSCFSSPRPPPEAASPPAAANQGPPLPPRRSQSPLRAVRPAGRGGWPGEPGAGAHAPPPPAACWEL